MTREFYNKNTNYYYEKSNDVNKTTTTNNQSIKRSNLNLKFNNPGRKISSQDGLRLEAAQGPYKLKRSSSELFIQKLAKSASSTSTTTCDESFETNSSNKFFKSKSSRNLNTEESGKLLKEYIKNHNTIRLYKSMPKQSMPPLHITNQDEVKRKFLESNVPPVLQFKADDTCVNNILSKHNKTNYNHFFKAKHILDLINSKFLSSDGIFKYYEANFGKQITSQEAVEYVGKYLTDNRINGELTVNFAPGLTCSGYIKSYGVTNNPETRKFVIWINDGNENQFLRQKGIVSLCDHEIGTHYYRSYNDGLQIWYGDRQKYGIRPLNSIELLRTEEGLAALHTLMNANLKFLYLPALLYYLACMADRMTFEQLFHHMARYIDKPEERWKLVTRVKRGISNPMVIGAYSRDQSYFEGAIEILENIDNIDFYLLMSGKLCVDELNQASKIAKLNALKLPKFIRNIDKYKDKLRHMGIVNGIIDPSKYSTFNFSISSSNSDTEFDKNDLAAEGLSIKNIKNYKDLYKLNQKYENFTSNEIKKYITEQIVANTKNTRVEMPASLKKYSSHQHGSSSLCTLL